MVTLQLYEEPVLLLILIHRLSLQWPQWVEQLERIVCVQQWMSIAEIPCVTFFNSVNALSALQLMQSWLMVCALMYTRHNYWENLTLLIAIVLENYSFGISRISLWRQPGRIICSILALKAQILLLSSEIVLVKIRYLDGFREEWLLLQFKLCPAGWVASEHDRKMWNINNISCM